jgi:hypothetical protein
MRQPNTCKNSSINYQYYIGTIYSGYRGDPFDGKSGQVEEFDVDDVRDAFDL